MGDLNFPVNFETVKGALKIDIAREDELEEIFEFMKQNFFPRKPICALTVCDPLPGSLEAFYTFVRDNVQVCLKHPISLTAREIDTNRLVAIRMNNLLKREEEEEKNHEESTSYLVPALFNALEDGFNLFNLYNTDRVFDLFVVNVSSEYGRSGLATFLYQLSLKMATGCGAGAVTVHAISAYAARATLKLGFTQLRELSLLTFEHNGTTPMAGREDLLDEHTAFRLFARPLP